MARGNRRVTKGWVALSGRFTFREREITFHGERAPLPEEGDFHSIGQAICEQRLSGGSLQATIEFSTLEQYEACQLILYYDPGTNAMVTAGLDGVFAFVVKAFDSRQWTTHIAKGERSNLKANVPYHVKIHRLGSAVTLTIDGVTVRRANLPCALPQSQVGVWCLSSSDIKISGFTVTEEAPKAFVVMQFSTPYDELYKDVIKPVCQEFGVEVTRADETVGPGLILQDVVRQINASTLIIAEITPPNPNVFYEVGYAHALLKPTILIAEKPTDLPFDVSGFRTLFYENTISGKKKIEEGLRKYIKDIISPQLPL